MKKIYVNTEEYIKINNDFYNKTMPISENYIIASDIDTGEVIYLEQSTDYNDKGITELVIVYEDREVVIDSDISTIENCKEIYNKYIKAFNSKE